VPTFARVLAGCWIASASALLGSSCGETAQPVPARPTNGVRVEWERRCSIALTEIAALGPEHSWAGDYRYEGDIGKRLILAPTGGCVAKSDVCVLSLPEIEEPSTINFGTVTEKNGIVRVTFERPNDPATFIGFHTEYTVHGTGSDRYLREVLLPGEPWGRVFDRERASTRTIVRGER